MTARWSWWGNQAQRNQERRLNSNRYKPIAEQRDEAAPVPARLRRAVRDGGEEEEEFFLAADTVKVGAQPRKKLVDKFGNVVQF